MLRAAASSVVVWSCLSVGCLETSSTVDTAAYPTMLTVSPASFRGALTCGGTGLHRYVVTLTDVSRIDAALAAPFSATPNSCSVPTSFSLDSSIGHAFIATIDGYDRDDIVPASPGSREMLQVGTGAVVCAKWLATCGDAPGVGSANPLRKPTTVIELSETLVTGCSSLVLVPSAACASDGADAGPSDGGFAADVLGDDAADASASDAGAGETSVGEAALPDVSEQTSSGDAAADVVPEATGPEDATRVDGPSADDASARDAADASVDASNDVVDSSPAQVLGDDSREGG